MMFERFLAGNHDFYDFKWPNHFSDGFIEFYGQKYVCLPKNLVWVHGGVVFIGKSRNFSDPFTINRKHFRGGAQKLTTFPYKNHHQ